MIPLALRAAALVPIVLVALAPTVVAWAAGPAVRPSVLLLTLDTTRADRLGCYGDPAALTPAMDRLSRQGALFEQAFSSVPLTLPSHATMMTGRYPHRLGVRDNGLHRVPGDAVTLAEILRGAGYATQAFVSAAVLDRAFGLDQGFDRYDDDVRVGRPEAFAYKERAASQVTSAAVEGLPSLRAPFLLWIHYYDPHDPYVPPRVFRSVPSLSDPYAGEVAFVDHAIAYLLQSLRARRLLDGTLTVVAGDHGESLGDHGEATHGSLISRAALQVPLLLAMPGRVAPGTLAPDLVRLVDVGPTILELVRLPVPAGIDGSPLAPVLAGGRTPVADLYEETLHPRHSYGWSPLAGLRTDRWHYVRGSRARLYDVGADPAERDDRAAREPEVLEKLDRILKEQEGAAAATTAVEPPPGLAESLASLGYLGAPSTASRGGRDPLESMPLLAELQQARIELQHGDLAPAVARLEALVRKDPENLTFQAELGDALLSSGRPAEAARAYRAALSRGSFDFLQTGLGRALAASGQIAPARAAFQKAIELHPRYAEGYLAWLDVELGAGDAARARAVADQAVAAGVRDPQLFLRRGRLALAAGDAAEGLRMFQEALRQDPDLADAHRAAGEASYARQQVGDAVASYERALVLAPDHLPTIKTLASLHLLHTGDLARARQLYRRALEIAPSAPDAGDLRDIIAGIDAGAR